MTSSVLRSVLPAAALLALITATAQSGSSQSAPDVQTYFRQNIGLSQDQIASIRGGHPVTKALPSRTPAEVFLFGAVYICMSFLRFERASELGRSGRQRCRVDSFAHSVAHR
jgi:hypothetical protein